MALRKGRFGFLSRKRNDHEGELPHPFTADTEKHNNFEIKELTERVGQDPDATLPVNYSEEEENASGSEHQHLEPVGSTYSSDSINAKPTTATLAETFSYGSSPEARDDQEESLFGGTYYASGYHNENDQGYTEFTGGTTEEDDLDTLDYTAADNEVYEAEHAEAMHMRSGVYGDECDGTQTEWDETTCSRTLNTNLEGINYVDGHVDQGYPMHYGQEMPNPHGYGHEANNMQPTHDGQYYYEDEAYDQFPVDAYTGQGYYDENGDFVRQYQEGVPYFDVGEDNTVANSTIATEGIDEGMEGKRVSIEGIIDEGPLESYESEDSNSSWDDEETRDMSLLDGSQDEEADQADTFDDGEDEDEDEDESSDDDSRARRRSRRHRRGRKNKSVLQLLNEMKNCSLKGSSMSYEDDEVPGVSQLSSASSSYDRKQSRGGKKQRKNRRNRRKVDTLFSKVSSQVSALGMELLDPDSGENGRRKSRKKRSSRRRDDDPATKLVESFRDIFSCGNPGHY